MIRMAWVSLILFLPGPGLVLAEETPRAIVERAVKAMGGARTLETDSARYMKLEGNLAQGGNFPLPGQVRMVLETRTMAGNKNNSTGHIEIAGSKTDLIHITNGNQGWNIDNGRVIEMTGDELNEREQSNYEDRVSGLVSLLEDTGYTLEKLGNKKVLDRTAVGVRVSRKMHPDIKLYFDQETALLVQISSIKKRGEESREEITTLGDYRFVDFSKATENDLKEAQIATETKELLRYLDRHIVRPENLQRVQQRIQQLADDEFEAREKASKDLIEFGPLALPLVRKAVKDSDVEVARRARDILKAIEQAHNPEMLLRVVRLLGLRKIAEAAEPLLTLVPGANPSLLMEIRVALLALTDNKAAIPTPLERALKDANPEIRATAEAVLSKDRGKWLQQPGRPLFPSNVKLPHSMSFEFQDKMTVDVKMVAFQLFNRFEDQWFAPPK